MFASADAIFQRAIKGGNANEEGRGRVLSFVGKHSDIQQQQHMVLRCSKPHVYIITRCRAVVSDDRVLLSFLLVLHV